MFPFRFPAPRHFMRSSGLERGPLSLVSITEELLGRKSSGSGIESREYGCRDPSRWPCDTLNQQKLTITSQTGGGRSVGIVRTWTQTTEFFLTIKSFYTCFGPFGHFQATVLWLQLPHFVSWIETHIDAIHHVFQSCLKRALLRYHFSVAFVFPVMPHFILLSYCYQFYHSRTLVVVIFPVNVTYLILCVALCLSILYSRRYYLQYAKIYY
jgi:hypothetical protein